MHVFIWNTKPETKKNDFTHINTIFYCIYFQCTYRPAACLETNHLNDMEVTDYEFHWGGLGMRFSCLRHPTKQDVVIRYRRADRANVAQYLVWPCLLLVALIAGLVWTYQRFGCGLCVRTSIAILTCRPVDKVYWRNGTIALGKL